MKPELNGTVDVSSSVTERQWYRTATSNNWNKLPIRALTFKVLKWNHLQNTNTLSLLLHSLTPEQNLLDADYNQYNVDCSVQRGYSVRINTMLHA